MRIRLARESELERLRDIELAADAAFAEIGMVGLATDGPRAVETLAPYERAGRAWVQADDDDRPVGFLIADIVDDAVHIEQVSIDPAFARRHLGRDLIEHVASWARSNGHVALTLTTFTDVPWNGPYYARCGFRFLAQEEQTPGLRRIRAEEAARGLDRWPRACMVRGL